MRRQGPSPNIALILLLAVLAACVAPGTGPTSAPTKTPEATFEPTPLPTTIPVTIIEPIPLPTTVPNQAEQINKATINHPVDFVIDTQQLKRGVVPPRFMSLDTWYKYTSPNGAFSVLMHGGLAPQESTLDELLSTAPPGVKVVKANYLMMENQAVSYFEPPALTSGELTPEQILDAYDFARLMGAVAEVEIISDDRIQLSGFPGRDVLLRAVLKDGSDVKAEMHVRVYIVGNTVYQLTYAGFGKSTHETEMRFLNSFTVHDTTKMKID